MKTAFTSASQAIINDHYVAARKLHEIVADLKSRHWAACELWKMAEATRKLKEARAEARDVGATIGQLDLTERAVAENIAKRRRA